MELNSKLSNKYLSYAVVKITGNFTGCLSENLKGMIIGKLDINKSNIGMFVLSQPEQTLLYASLAWPNTLVSGCNFFSISSSLARAGNSSSIIMTRISQEGIGIKGNVMINLLSSLTCRYSFSCNDFKTIVEIFKPI